MFTPQQIQEISFEKALFNGYDMDSVDDVLEPLTQDYLTLYKENSVLKSKLRILVEKLEEYRRQEASMQNAILTAQKTAEQMVADAEKRCAKLLHEAELTAANKANDCSEEAQIEVARLAAAKEACGTFFDSMEKRLKRQLEMLEELRKAELKPDPKPVDQDRRAFDFDSVPNPPTEEEREDALIAEIGQNIQVKLNGGTLGEQAKAEEKKDLSRTRRFEDLQFGRNYRPNEKG